ncbi:MAG: dTDP-4-keto-6-deoxy-D-glucose epimerase [Acidimicrobiales bacterium]|nr:MAG: dTDP-4-keto-6-deoxy-D-glucose epimerase [Acidimicrobiales bacterium]
MQFTETPLAGAYVIDLDPIVDHRGFFARAWAANEFTERGLDPTIAQMNMSESLLAGTFRGFHWQEPPFGETKTVRCIAGSVFNAIIDMRPASPTYRQWFGTELSAENLRMLYVPEQFANGFLILEDNTRLLYNVSRPHEAGNENGIRWDDPVIDVDWPAAVVHVSDKDQGWPTLAT